MGSFRSGGGQRNARGETSTNSGTGGTANPKAIIAGGFPDDGARRMPSSFDMIAIENMKRMRALLSGKSGRASTNLAGTRSYVNSFAGGTL